MDPEKPKSDSTGERPSERLSAEQRADRLFRREGGQKDERKPEDAPKDRAAGSGGSDKPESDAVRTPPRLTERQRREAREQRRQRGRSRSRKASDAGTGSTRLGATDGSGNPLSRGVRATLVELRRTAGFFRVLILSGLDRLGSAIRWLSTTLLELLRAAGAGLSALGRLLAAAASRLGKAVAVLDRHVTPRRALLGVVAAGIAALTASQFLDFRATEIGQAAYDPIQEIARAPRIDVLTPMDSHSILLLAVGAMALAGLAGTAITSSRVFGGLIAVAGIVTIAVTLLVDLPKGLDIAVAEISYSGVVAVLLSGFWAQLAAGFVLATAGLGLFALSRQRGRSVSPTSKAGTRSSEDRERRKTDSRRNEPRPLNAGGLS